MHNHLGCSGLERASHGTSSSESRRFHRAADMRSPCRQAVSHAVALRINV
ncbi:hypothetical protein AOX55_00006785 (plasmid) [Sinorhizobium fredii CCBAU 25509]|nr:hypothetical protein SF83666_b68360 [Sinorhizobium fredii CCBAU 83666]AWM29560.1 hypothetical protein AOX55_00006785 [Sinorhizobium fredii CCBAU 25509]